MSPFLLYAAAGLAGALTNVAVGANQQLDRGLQQPMLSALIMQTVGLVMLLAIALARGVVVPAGATLAGMPWWV